MSGLPRVYSAGTVDQWPKNLSSALLFGGMWTFPIPDLDRTDYLLDARREPARVAGQPARRARHARAARRDPRARRQGGGDRSAPHRHRGARRRVARDPSRHRRRAPARDGARAVRGGPRRARAGSPGASTGIDEVRALCGDVHARGGRGDVRHPGRRRSAASRASSRPRRAPRSTAASAPATRSSARSRRGSVDVVNVLTGNLDREGGSMFANPIAWSLTSLHAARVRRTASTFAPLAQPRARRARGARPGADLVPRRGDRDAGPGPDPRARSRSPAIPVLSAPDAAKLDAALPGLECMVSLDNWLNETTRHAHVILPGLSRARAAALRRDDLELGGAQRGQVLARALRPGPSAPPSGRCCSMLAAILPGREARRRSTSARDRPALLRRPRRGGSRRCRARASAGATPPRSSRRRKAPGPSGCSTSRSAPGRGATRYGANPGGLTLAELKRAAERHRHRARSRRASTRSCARRRARSSSRRPTSPRTSRGSRAASRGATTASCSSSRRHVRSNNSWMHNVADARDRQGPLHAARAPRRRRAARPRGRQARARRAPRPASSWRRSR